MRKVILAGVLLGALVMSGCAATRPSIPFVEEGSCSPDILAIGKVSKLPTVLWNQPLFSTGFASRALNQTGTDIAVIFGKYENFNIVNVEIKIDEKSMINPQFISGYRAAKGNAFSFGFTNGTQMKFVASDVSNVTQSDYLKKMPVTTVILSTTGSDEDVMATISGLTNQQIDSVRIELAGSVGVIEESVDSSNGKKVMEKLSCFYQYLDRARGASK